MTPVEGIQNRTEPGQTTGQTKPKTRKSLARDHADFWAQRLKKRGYLDRDGTRVEVPEWQVRLFHAGRESWLNLGTSNRKKAAERARDASVCLKLEGWDKMLAKFKAEAVAAPRLNLTVGQFLSTVKVADCLRLRTFLNYQNCLRTIVSEVFGVKGGEAKYDYRQGGNQAWVERIDSIRLERVTPDCVTKWQHRRLKKAGHSPVAQASAKRTINSYVRCARSLFGKDILKHKSFKDVVLPSPLPFAGVELFENGSQKYVSKVDVHALVAAARNELKPNPKDRDAYLALVLGLFAGMRKGEIDLAEWGMVDWQESAIKLEETQWLHLKTDDSAGKITIDQEVTAELKAFKPSSTSGFILNSDRPPRNDSALAYYRCEPAFARLTQWLRSKGVKANKPLHELRKEIGALVATEHGIYAASRFLRHSDITTTARHYADHKDRISVGLGKLLDTTIKVAKAK